MPTINHHARNADTVRVVAVIVNFNGGDLTSICLDSLKECATSFASTLVVDNASEDGSLEILAKEDGKSIELIANKENLGFAKACNQAMARALELDADFVFLMNNDARLAPSAVNELLAAAERHPKAALFGGKIYDGDGPQLWCAGMDVGFYPNLQRLRGFHQPDVAGRFDDEETVDALTGCALLMRRDFIEEGGYFDEDFFVYVEDLELSLRARSMGWTCCYVPTATIYHDAGSTSGPGYSPWRKYMLAYNLVLFLGKRKSWRLWLSFIVLDLILWPLTLVVGVVTKRTPGALAKGRGMLHALLRRPARPHYS